LEGEKEIMLVGDLVTTKEAAELLRVSPWTISAWLSQGKLRRVKAGGRTLIAKADLEAFLRRGATQAMAGQQ
jgi:excisionase family DNA binding protein